MAKMGAPTRFNEAVARRILDLATAGDTEDMIAAKIGISKTTLSNWKNRYPDFMSALKESKNVADELVEASLFQRAIGYNQPGIKIFCKKDGEIVTHQFVERFAPDVTACIFWLKNRQPDKWRDVSRSELTGAGGAPLGDGKPVQVIITLPKNGREPPEPE